jgi:leader peptidase (prepilin peptidase)/N-methyltransferase
MHLPVAEQLIPAAEALAAVPSGLLAALGFTAGAIVGSFLATILLRWPAGRSVSRGRSRCDACGEGLRATDLVPILSFLLLRGRCRRCGAAIDPRHVAVEITAALVGLVAMLAHPSVTGIVSAMLGWWLLLIAALDAEDHWLPDLLTLPLLVAGLLVAWLGVGASLEARAIGAVAGFALLWAIALGYRAVRGREGMGGGDPKLFAALGAWLGWQQLPLVLLGAGLAGLAAVALMAAKGRGVAMTDRLPLGTLMALAAWPIWLVTAA